MAAGLNKVILIGNLTADPELKYTASGTARTKFRIAVNRQWKNSNGELQEEATFIPIVAWGAQAENCANYLSKGRSVAVEGRLRIYSFEGDGGERVYATEVVARNVQFLGGPQQSAPEPGMEPATSDRTDKDKDKGEDEEVPF